MPCRPAEYRTVSAGIFFPLARWAMAPSGWAFDRGHGLTEPEGHREVAQVVLERLDDLQVAELEHPVPLLDHGDLGAQGGEHRGVLDPDDPGAGHDHRPRHPPQVDDPVGVEDGPLVEGDAGRAGRVRPGRDHDGGRADPATRALVPVDLEHVRFDETRQAGQDRDPVAGELAAHDVVFPADHVLGARHQVTDGDLFLDPVARPVHLALVEPGEVEDRLAHRLGRDRAGVEAHPADHFRPLHERDPAVELGRGDGGLLPARARTDHQQVEVMHVSQCDDLWEIREGVTSIHAASRR